MSTLYALQLLVALLMTMSLMAQAQSTRSFAITDVLLMDGREAQTIPTAGFLEVASSDHADLSQSEEAIERIRRFCEELR